MSPNYPSTARLIHILSACRDIGPMLSWYTVFAFGWVPSMAPNCWFPSTGADRISWGDGGIVTAEIAVVNRNGVALAADSAGSVKIGPNEGAKVFNDATKLVMLSEVEPVGIMTYGVGSFVGIHWDIIFREYRREYGDLSFPHLIDYVHDFIDFIGSDQSLFPPDEKLQWLGSRVVDHVLETIADSVKAADFLREQGAPEEFVKAQILEMTSRDGSPSGLKHRGKKPLTEFKQMLGTLIEDIAGQVSHKLSAELLDLGLSLADVRSMATRALYEKTGLESGIVIAGYGNTDIFPSVYAFSPLTIADSAVLYQEAHDPVVMDRRSSMGVIQPYAQRDVVDSFLYGVDTDRFFDGLACSLDPQVNPRSVSFDGATIAALSTLSSVAHDIIGENLSGSAASEATQKIEEAVHALGGMFGIRCEQAREAYYEPIGRAVNFLTKEGLAELAESLVSITSLKRRFTMASESVGGAIDVAVITRSDGFVWIKRKLYFDEALNPHFMSRFAKAREPIAMDSPAGDGDGADAIPSERRRGRPRKIQ